MNSVCRAALKLPGIVSILALTVSCGIPPVDETFISNTPASAEDMLVARNAVTACGHLPNRAKAKASFEQFGFTILPTEETRGNGKTYSRLKIQAPSPRVKVIFAAGKSLGGRCYVGVENMTPNQSAELARGWVRKYKANSNSEYGDGLSDHVSGAWRSFFTEVPYHHRVYIAAYKTWPHGPYDPQRQFGFDVSDVFPKRPGAAVSLSYAMDCIGVQMTSKDTGVIYFC